MQEWTIKVTVILSSTYNTLYSLYMTNSAAQNLARVLLAGKRFPLGFL